MHHLFGMLIVQPIKLKWEVNLVQVGGVITFTAKVDLYQISGESLILPVLT
jgi:hypothetical protein